MPYAVLAGLLWGCASPPPLAPVEVYDIASADPAAQVSLGHLLGTGRAHGVGEGPDGIVTFLDGRLYVSAQAQQVKAGTPYAGTAQRLWLSQVPAWTPVTWARLSDGPFRFTGSLHGATASDTCAGAAGPPSTLSGEVVGIRHGGEEHVHVVMDGRALHLVSLGEPGAGPLLQGVSR